MVRRVWAETLGERLVTSRYRSFAAAGFPVSKPELSALFRLPGHKNFRRCGDQLLRNFLKGLALRVRGTQ